MYEGYCVRRGDSRLFSDLEMELERISELVSLVLERRKLADSLRRIFGSLTLLGLSSSPTH